MASAARNQQQNPPAPLQLLGTQVAQPIPFSQEAEECTIGGILTNPNAYYEVSMFLTAEDFFIVRNRYVFEAMQSLAARNEPVGDYMLIVNELKSQNRLGEIGGAAYLTQLINSVPTSMHTVAYARLVERAAIRRALMEVAYNTIKVMGDESIELSEAISKTEGAQIEITSRFTGSGTQGMQQAVSALYERTERLVNNPGDVHGVLTGFTELDRVFMGFDNQSLTLLGGRPGMGKTSMMLSTALQMAKRGCRILYFSMEMGVDQMMNRLMAMEAKINSQRLRGGQLSADEWGRFVEASGNLAKLPLFIDDTSMWTPQLMKAKCTSMKRRQGVDLIMVDYAGLMNGGGRYKDNKVQETGFISRSLKGMARDLRTPVWAAVQLNRGLESRQDKRPMLSDLRESGDWEQDADNVMFLYRDEVYNEASEFPNQADVIIAKHRNGPVGTVSLYFEKTLTKFMNAAERSVDLSHI